MEGRSFASIDSLSRGPIGFLFHFGEMGVVSRRDGSKGAMDGTVEDFVENKEEGGEGEDCFSVAEGWIRSSFERKEGVEGTVRDFLLSRRGLEIGNDDYLFTSI